MSTKKDSQLKRATCGCFDGVGVLSGCKFPNPFRKMTHIRHYLMETSKPGNRDISYFKKSNVTEIEFCRLHLKKA